MRYHRIPAETVRRLPVYLNALLLSLQQGKSISSSELSAIVGINPLQIRKDFSYFGGFGTRGVGYNIEKLIKKIKKILKLDSHHQAVLVGAGNLGSAVLAYPGFAAYGFQIAAAYDSDPAKIGKTINNITIEDAENIINLKKKNIKIGIIAVPRQQSQAIAQSLVKAGVTGILNFSPCRLAVPKRVKVITINIATDLARLPFYMPADKKIGFALNKRA
jgi:redox-sensing transcriptional repressor